MPTTAEYRRFADTCLHWAYGGQSLNHSMVTKPLALRLGSGPFDNARRAGPPGELAVAVAYIVRSVDVEVTLWQFAFIGAQEGIASLMTRLQNRCASCGGKLGLVCQHYWRLRFCCKACKTSFLRKRPSALALYRPGRERR
jgi:hypothetical protein